MTTSAKSDDDEKQAPRDNKDKENDPKDLQKFPFKLNLKKTGLPAGREKRHQDRKNFRASGLTTQAFLQHSAFTGRREKL